MISVKIVRAHESDAGTFGRIIAPGLTLFTGELPDRNNLPNISRVLEGKYDMVWAWSNHFRRWMYLMLGTAPRAGIRAHSANFMGDATRGLKKQLNGCIALGEKVGVMDGQRALLVSAPAVRRFEEHMERKPFRLEIINDIR